MRFSLKPVTEKILAALRQGTTPRMLAITFALGIVLGIFPVFGTTTLICLGVALLFRLNVPLLQLINYLVAPLQLLLIIPFIKAGAYVFGLEPLPYSVGELITLFRTDLWRLLKEAGLSLLLGTGVWAVVAIPLFLVIFLPSYWFFNQWKVTRYREL